MSDEVVHLSDCENKLISANGREKQVDTNEDAEDAKCGFWRFKPQCLQGCTRMGVFAGTFSICALMSQVSTMYIVSQITTLEKQFGLTSGQSGFLLSCNDVGFLLTTLPAGYIARKIHIPRALCMAAILCGIGGLISSSAYYISRDLILEQASVLFRLTHDSADNIGELTNFNSSSNVVLNRNKTTYSYAQGSLLCHTDIDDLMASRETPSDGPQCTKQDTEFRVGIPNRYTSVALGLIAIGMILIGASNAPRFPFTTTYVDDNGVKQDTAMYIGVITGVAILAPAVSFFAGGFFSWNYVTLQDVPINTRHPAWIGAWWLGFLVFGLLSIVVSFPLICFPRRMGKQQSVHEPKRLARKNTTKHICSDFWKCLRRLFTNSVYMPLVLAVCFKLFSSAGYMSFIPKYIETQFVLPTWKANMFIGGLSLITACAGSIIGGCTVSKMKLSPLVCVKMLLVVSSLIALLVGFTLFLGCGNASIVGFNRHGAVSTNVSLHANNGSCISSCGCDGNHYFPVCGSDKNTYMTPCHAGCTKQGEMLYSDCTCISINGTATSGLCENECSLLYPFLVALAVWGFLETFCTMPILITAMRSVLEKDKSMAVGLFSFMITLFGWCLGPVIFGQIVDTSCIIWNTSCTGKGACALYDNDDFRIKTHTTMLLGKICSLALLVFVFVKARKKQDWSGDNGDENVKVAGDNELMSDIGKTPDKELEVFLSEKQI